MIVDASTHILIDLCLSCATLFLHEDIVAKTLQFEHELMAWQIAEIQAGWGDPGRPGYGYIFLTVSIFSCYYVPVFTYRLKAPRHLHLTAGIHYWGTLRSTPDSTDSTMFRKEQCPGIDPPHPDPFPVFNTLLSMPFSLLHNLPRLSSIITGSPFQRNLITMAVEIMRLWGWDSTFPTNTPITVSNTQCSPMPRPIYDPSCDATFAMMWPPPPCTMPNTVGLGAPSESGCVVQPEAASGAYVVGASHCVHLQNSALTAVPLDHNMNMEKEPICQWCHTVTHSAATSLTRSASLSGSIKTIPELGCADSNEPNLDVASLQARVAAWLEDLDKEALDPLPADKNDTKPFMASTSLHDHSQAIDFQCKLHFLCTVHSMWNYILGLQLFLIVTLSTFQQILS